MPWVAHGYKCVANVAALWRTSALWRKMQAAAKHAGLPQGQSAVYRLRCLQAMQAMTALRKAHNTGTSCLLDWRVVCFLGRNDH